MPPIGPRKEAQARAAAAYQRRCMGQTWEAISKALGYRNRTSAAGAVRDHISRLPPEDQATARALSAGNYEALKDQLWQTLATAKANGDRNGVTQAARAIADIQDRHDKLLGITAPTQVDITLTPAAQIIEDTRHRLLQAIEQGPRGVQVVDGEVIDYGSVKHRRELT